MGRHQSVFRRQRLPRSFADVRKSVGIGWALFKGVWYKRYYRFRGVRFSAGEDFRVYGRLSVSGPGEVVFGNHVYIHQLATPWTYSGTARIVVGNNVSIGTARF